MKINLEPDGIKNVLVLQRNKKKYWTLTISYCIIVLGVGEIV
jgi:hypothetical protein